MSGVRTEIAELGGWLTDIRRDLHRHPELGYNEHRTSKVIREILTGLGLEVRPRVGGTGVLGLWRADRPGPCLGLRADMDALPIHEGVNRPWRSDHDGVMHACGHDLHVAMLLGTARFLSENETRRRDLVGSVKFIFQPAEEAGAGAGAMIADGALKNPEMDALFAAHVAPTLPVGGVGYAQGPAMASADIFHVIVKGRGGHAAHPDLAADPIAPAAELVVRLKRRAAELESALLAVCTFNAGTQTNVIPDQAVFSGAIRGLKNASRERAREMLLETVRQAEKESGLAMSVRISPGYPMLHNDPAMTDRLVRIARETVGPEMVFHQGPTYGSEDLAFFLEKIPGAMYWLGCGRDGVTSPAMLHSSEFDPDESVMPLGVEIMTRLIEDFLGPGAGVSREPIP